MIKVYGQSDDLIEIEGDIIEEYRYYGTTEDEPCILAFDNGTILKCFYDTEGIWRFQIMSHGNIRVTVEQPDLTKDEYSEIVTIDAPIKVIGFGGDAQYYIKR